SRLARPPPELHLCRVECRATQPRRHPSYEGGLPSLEPLAELLGSADLGVIDEVRVPPPFPGPALALHPLLEPPERRPNRLAIPDHDPDTHRHAACTAAALPVERAFSCRTPQAHLPRPP